MSSDSGLFPKGCADPGKGIYELGKQMTRTEASHCGRREIAGSPEMFSPKHKFLLKLQLRGRQSLKQSSLLFESYLESKEKMSQTHEEEENGE